MIRAQQPPTPDLHSDDSSPTVESDATMDFRKRRNHSPPPQSKRNKKRENYTPGRVLDDQPLNNEI